MTPRFDATREELVDRVMVLQRLVLRSCESTIDQEALNLHRVSETINGAQKSTAITETCNDENIQINASDQANAIPSVAISTQPSTFNVFTKLGELPGDSQGSSKQVLRNDAAVSRSPSFSLPGSERHISLELATHLIQ
jgi:hypothetical protein